MNSSMVGGLVDRAAMRFESDIHRALQAGSLHPSRVITVSRTMGSNGRDIAEALSKRLGWPLWDERILEVAASQSQLGYKARMLRALDQKGQDDIEAVVSGLLGMVNKHVYMHLLSKAILSVAQGDAVILDRGAYLLLPHALSVRIDASIETRVQNLVDLHGFGREVARREIKKSDEERAAFLRELGGRSRFRRSSSITGPGFDLTINTDSFSVDEAVSLILTVASTRFHLHPEPLARAS